MKGLFEGGILMADGAVSGAAAAARRRKEQEEEEMTAYSPEDMQKYEFKIVRANWGVFGNPQKFKQLLQEEAQSGWELVEKFDNERVRFKRPLSYRDRDSLLPVGVDPYRAQYGMPPLMFALLIVFAVLAGLALVFGLVFGIITAIIGAGTFFAR
jgi:hypothetical protein